MSLLLAQYSSSSGKCGSRFTTGKQGYPSRDEWRAMLERSESLNK